jgi:hypothetical protein
MLNESRFVPEGGDLVGADGRRYQVVRGSSEAVQDYLRKDSGAQAIALSKAIQEYKQRDRAADDIATVRHVEKKLFYLINGRWIDGEYKAGMKTKTVVFASDEYFELLDKKPELKRYLALGERVTVVLDDGTALVVEVP